MPAAASPNPEILLPRPTFARYIVLAFLCAMAFVLYLDRVCISQALVPMKTEFELTNRQTSYVLMAFTLAYGLFEIPTGRWGDRYGSRRVLTRIVLWWSAFTALTGCVWKFSHDLGAAPLPYPLSEWFEPIPLVFDSLVLLILVRFLFGAGEAGAMPNSARIMLRWFPVSERGRIQGLFQASMHVGGFVAPVGAAMIIDAAGWRWTFGIFGMAGVVWAGAFYWWFREKPGEHPAVNLAEAQLIGAPPHGDVQEHDHVPWRDVVTHPTVWLLCFIIIFSSFNSYFFFSWYPTYLQEAHGFTNRRAAGWLAALALLGGTIGSVTGGFLTDLITRRTANRYRGRRLLCSSGFISAAACLVACVHADVTLLSFLFFPLACLLMFCQLPTWWACAFDLSGKHTGSLFGLLNGVGVIGAIASQYFFGAFSDWRKELGYVLRDRWDPAFYVCAALLLLAGVLWQFMYPRRAIGEVSSP